MKSSILLSAVVLFGSVTAVITPLSCYSSSIGTNSNVTADFNSMGKCAKLCPTSAAFAISDRSQCYCADSLPNDGDKVDTSKCNFSCPGWTEDNCGGKNYFFFYDAGIANAIPKADNPSPASTSTTASSATSSAKASTVAPSEKTVLVTSSSKPSATSAPASSKPNVAAIAAGVVVGVVAIAGIMGGLFLFMRNKKRRAIEEEHRRNAAVNSFTKPPISSAATSFNDTRLDPVMAHRRMSDGSIADNQDYSRRILKVTNA